MGSCQAVLFEDSCGPLRAWITGAEARQARARRLRARPMASLTNTRPRPGQFEDGIIPGTRLIQMLPTATFSPGG
jgi:hypothetical protein